ncbi:hypothetical protein [Lysobacter gummosus]|uniref:hypothetical protein n=1 Tax=Lysobacter gummosus TaxID=262324 RepID=UPI003632D7E6
MRSGRFMRCAFRSVFAKFNQRANAGICRRSPRALRVQRNAARMPHRQPGSLP